MKIEKVKQTKEEWIEIYERNLNVVKANHGIKYTKDGHPLDNTKGQKYIDFAKKQLDYAKKGMFYTLNDTFKLEFAKK